MRVRMYIALLLILAGCQRRPVTERPDVILITIDTLRADRISPYGYSRPTPALESFARDAVLFERAWCQVPLTLPSHASILTGLYPMAHGVRENSGFILSSQHRTLTEALRDNGYSTAAFIGSFVLDRRFGLDRGFETYYDNFSTGTLEDVELQIQERRAAEVLARAKAWFEAHPAAPRFAWIHLYDPHAPYEPPPPFDREADLYDGEVAYVDQTLGGFFQYLRSRDLYEESLVIVTSDHGEGLGEHGEETHGMFLYESTLRVPLLVKYPGNASAGVRTTETAELVDIYPTVLSILNIKDPAAVQGHALQPGREESNGRTNIAETMLPYLGYGWSPLRSYMEGSYKFIDAPRAELYDLKTDPTETRNLAGTDDVTSSRLRQRLAASFARLSASKPAPPSHADPETSDRLRSLGYASTSRAAFLNPPRGLVDPKDRITVFESIWKAEKDLARGRAEEAARALSDIVARDSQVYLAQWLLGLARYKQGLFTDALGSFNAAAALRPEEFRPFMYAGLSSLRLGRFAEARSALEKAREIRPDEEAVLNNLGTVYVKTQELDKAVAIFKELTRRNSSDIAAWSNLGVVSLLKKDYTSAYDSFQQALQLKPDQPEIHNNLGLIHMERGEIDAAIGAYRQALVFRPDYGRAHFNLGLALQKKGLRAEAEREFSLAKQ